MKRYLIAIILVATPFIMAIAQDTLTLGDCYKAAEANHSLAGEKELLRQVANLNDQIASSGYLPSVEAGASLVYNTNVVDLGAALESIPIPGIAENITGMPHDQYKLTVDIQQVIWDGGVISERRKAEQKKLLVSQKEVDIELYKIREQVNNLYFSIMATDKQVILLNTYLESIRNTIKDIDSGISNGLLLPSDRDLVMAEKVNLEQQVLSLEIRRESLMDLLSEITGQVIGQTVVLSLPHPAIKNDEILRPELKLFDLKTEQLMAGKELLRAGRKPKAFGFATLGYGKPPGNDFFNESFGPYATLGAGLKWTIYDWNKNKREMQAIDVTGSILESRKNNLKDNISRALRSKQAEIDALEEALKSDEKIIMLRENISKVFESRLRNGSVTTTEYLVQLNAEKQARMNFEIHTINLAMARIDFATIAGSEIK